MSLRTVVKKFIPSGFFPKIEPYGHLAEAMLFNTINGFPARGMKVIGVTGTNGKTTTAFLIHKMLREAGYTVGLNTTVSYGVNEDIRPQLHHMTNVTVPELMQRLKWMKSQGVEWLVLETTSHALAQNRVWGVPYSIAVMTNITHEHLGFHGTFERYVQAKKKLFVLANRNKKGLRTGIINADDPNARVFFDSIAHPILYSVEKSSSELQKSQSEVSNIDMLDPHGELIYASHLKLTAGGSRYLATVGNDEYKIECHLPGSFNVSNSLAAIAVGRAIGLTKDQIQKGIASLKGVEGRMTHIDEGQDFNVVVDYAHTPDSFEKLFADVRPMVKGRIIAVFGSLGGGDTAKRPIQGEIAGKYGDEVIVTQEDDRQEDPSQIMNDIAAGAEKSGKVRGKDLLLIHDRTDAITAAFEHARKGDLVLLLGKGHEKTQEDASGEHPWDESTIARTILKKLH